ncbi:hypothetical protein PFLuk1_02876 [Pseudomonas fluorescens]|nr:hypothetical protein PFLuk1_02876 [Pseudomonas fluorescens]
MSLGLQGTLAHLVQQLLAAHLPVDIGLEHLGVDEEADQPLGFQAIAVGNRHAHAHIFLAAVAMQQRLVRRQQQHRQRDASVLRQCAQTAQQLRMQLDTQACAAMAWLCRARMVERQLQHRLLAAQLLAPVGQLTRLLPRLHPTALPHGIIAVLDRQRRQLHVLALAVSGIRLHQLLDHQLHRPAVRDDVMLHQHQHMVVLGQAQQGDPQQRPMQQVERLGDHLRDPRLEAGIVAVDLLDIDPALGVNDLNRAGGVLTEIRAQAFMASQQAIKALLQRGQVQRPVQPQGAGDVIRGAGRVQLPEEPLALLGIRQRQWLRAIGLDQRRRGDALLAQGLHEITQ